MRNVRMFSRMRFAAAALALAGSAAAGRAGPADDLLDAAGVKAGLCVHLGCGDGKLTAELARGRNLLVHGLATDPAEADRARQHVRSRKLYGQVAVEVARPTRLPYADNLVNLIVVEDLPGRLKSGMSMSEIMRVVCPNGVAMLGGATAAELKAALAGAGVGGFETVGAGGVWAKVVKPRPAGMDEWTHVRHGPGGSAVSTDTLVATPVGVRWIAGPAWPMGFHKKGSSRILSANGRNFYVTFNTFANIARTVEGRAKSWSLLARDAFNGTLLWTRPLSSPSRVAAGDRLFTAVKGRAVALDAATGKLLITYAKAPPATSMLAFCDGTLLVAGRYAAKLTALDPDTGAVRWKAANTAAPLVGEGKVFFVRPREKKLVCLDFTTGRQLWSADVSGQIRQKEDRLLFVKAGVLAFQNFRTGDLHVFSAADGKHLWSYPTAPGAWKPTRSYVFHTGKLVWVMYRSTKARSNAANEVTLEGLDPRTGASRSKHVVKPGRVGNCGTTPVASERYFMFVRPLKFLDWSDGTIGRYQGARGSCGSYITPANGLSYNQPIDCKCFLGMLRGFMALAPAGAEPVRPTDDADRLTKGPAYGQVRGAGAAADPQLQWPTFRHDPRRSCATPAPVPERIGQLWQAAVADQSIPQPLGRDWLAGPLGADPLTQPTVAGGKVFLSLPEAHQVVALDAGTGKVLWAFTAAGRLDTPPTIHRGLALLGCRDGFVYCLRAADGKLVWRYQGAPADRRILAFGQLESKWPVVGGVLVEGGRAIFSAGRGTYADGGITAGALDPATGKLLWKARPGPRKDRRRTYPPSFRADLLVSDGKTLHMAHGRAWRLDLKTGRDAAGGFGGLTGGGRSTACFLDRSWHWLDTYNTAAYHMRTYRASYVGGHLILHDAGRAYLFVKYEKNWRTGQPDRTAAIHARDFGSLKKKLWSLAVAEPMQVEAMAVAGGQLFAAGPIDRRNRSAGGFLWAVSAADGKILAEHKLPAPPVADGLAVAGGKLYLATEDGKARCYGARP